MKDRPQTWILLDSILLQRIYFRANRTQSINATNKYQHASARVPAPCQTMKTPERSTIGQPSIVVTPDNGERERIKKELGARNIKLWMPPYYGVQTCQNAVKDLAEHLLSDTDKAENHLTTKSAIDHLEFFQGRALDKLRTKGRLLEELHIQMLGSKVPKENQHSSTVQTWAEEMQTVPNKNSLVLCRVNPTLTLAEFGQQISSYLSPEEGTFISPRLVHKGKVLLLHGENANTTCLSRQFANSSGKAKVLCMVQKQEAPSAAGTTTPPTTNPDQDLIDSIRTAAGKLQSNTMLDITDAKGNLVSMTQANRRAFLLALGLHAVGKERIRATQNNNIPSNDPNLTTTDDNNNNNNNSALIFLLEADAEWNSLDDSWRSRVDNYGLLQLDIAWVHLKLQSLEHLPSVIQRLDRAEHVLRSQVNANFVTLALVLAEQGDPVPAVAAIFVRLFLLQGVAYYHCDSGSSATNGYKNKSMERLEWAWALAKSLRTASPPDDVARLVEVLGATEFQVISALRRANGNVDRAAEMIEQDKVDAEKATQDRFKQRKFGLCQDGKEYVDMKSLAQLLSLLNLSDVTSANSESEMIASGLLRLSNNDINRAIDIYGECMRDPATISQRVVKLDQSQGVRRPHKRIRQNVDETALATLVSMGVDNETAKRALITNSNNIERALLWLSTITNPTAREEVSGATGREDSTVLNSAETSVETSYNNDRVANTLSASDGETDPNSSNGSGSAPTPVTSSRVRRDTSRRQELSGEELLKRVLGGVLEKQNEGEDCLGYSLEEEWGYIMEYQGLLSRLNSNQRPSNK